ncbi:hypothetical protein Bhyg_00677 [Pseudolycoriella hygida]|uniref:Uncharacterized protein n=1 Tax=Pseudolycoriella hygida TaxID=35572 RepID=A0A9Q0N9G7_9DIPT|nr:hypothetical protein Bhyg_00677 [Pseudolycoriella hygida]
MLPNQFGLIAMFHVVVGIIAWPTLRLKVQKYSYHIFQSDVIDFNITEIEDGQTLFYDFKKDNLMLSINNNIRFEDGNKEFSIEFMNKTSDVCKIFSNRRHDPIVGLFFEILQEKTPTLPKKCPIKKQIVSVPLQNFETNKLPPIWPRTSILFEMRLYSYTKKIFKPLLNLTMIVNLQKK